MRRQTRAAPRPLFVGLITLLLVGASNLHAADLTATWNGTTGNWSEGSRWSTNPLFPQNSGQTFDAVVNNGTVTLDLDVVIDALTQTGGVINGAGDLDLNVGLTWSGGNHTGAGITTNLGTANISNSVSLGRTLRNGQTMTFNLSSNNVNNLSGAGLIDNLAGANLTFNATGNNTIGPPVNNAGNLFKIGTGSVVLNQSFTNTGAVSVTAGELRLADGGNLGGSIHVDAPGVFRLATGSFTVSGTFSGDNILMTSGTATNDVDITLGLDLQSGTWTGAGPLRVTSLNWTGGDMTGTGETVNTGTANLSATVGIGRVFRNQGTMNITLNSQNLNSLGGAIVNDPGGVIQLVGTGNNNISVPVQNDGDFHKSGAGTVRFNGSFENNATVTVEEGTLNFVGGYSQIDGLLELAGGTVQTNDTLDILGGAIGGQGTILGSVELHGRIEPGSQINITGDLDTVRNAQYLFHLGGTQQGIDYDFLSVGGSATLDGALEAAFVNGFENGVQPTDVFTILSSGGLAGNFSNVLNGEELIVGPGRFTVFYGNGSPFSPDDVVLTNFAIPEPNALALVGVLIGGVGWRLYRRRSRRQ